VPALAKKEPGPVREWDLARNQPGMSDRIILA
jgi:hypothetical protein